MIRRLALSCCSLVLVFLSVLLLSPIATAQKYPDHPIRMVIPFAAGGSPDVIGRIIAEELAAMWGQPVLIENRAGAGGNIAAEYVLDQPGDGYTLFLGTTGSMATNKALYRRLKFDPQVDFVPVSLLYASCNVLILSKNNPIQSLPDLIAEAKRNPGKMTFGSPGVGTAGHLVAELFKMRTQTDLVHVPYRGQAQVLTDLLGGHLTMSFEAIGGVVPSIKSGDVRGLAATCRERSKQLPDIPTFAELGIADFALEALALLAVSAKTPPNIVQQLNEAIVKIVATPKVADKINGLGVQARTSTSAQARALLNDETARWRQVVEIAKIPLMD